MANSSNVSVNMIIDAQESELHEEAIDQCFFTPLTTDSAQKTDEMEDAPEGVVERKTELVEHGQKSIKYGAFLQLTGEGTFEGQTLIGQGEEGLVNVESESFFSEVNHAVPYDVKGLNAHLNKAYDLVKKPRKALSTWHGRYQEQCAWQALFRRHNDRVTAVHGTDRAPQRWHSNIFAAEVGGLAKVAWLANQGTYIQNISAAINGLTTGDVINADRVRQMGIAVDDLHLTPINVTIDGASHKKLIWAYPRAERYRIAKAFESFWLSGDVRGPNNRAFKGDRFAFDRFLFVEAAEIPQIVRVDANNINLLQSWAPNATTKKRGNQRTNSHHTHAILGANSLCFAEPQTLSWKAVEVDAGRKETLAALRVMGYARHSEYYDHMYTPTMVLSQGSALVITSAT